MIHSLQPASPKILAPARGQGPLACLVMPPPLLISFSLIQWNDAGTVGQWESTDTPFSHTTALLPWTVITMGRDFIQDSLAAYATKVVELDSQRWTFPDFAPNAAGRFRT